MFDTQSIEFQIIFTLAFMALIALYHYGCGRWWMIPKQESKQATLYSVYEGLYRRPYVHPTTPEVTDVMMVFHDPECELRPAVLVFEATREEVIEDVDGEFYDAMEQWAQMRDIEVGYDAYFMSDQAKFLQVDADPKPEPSNKAKPRIRVQQNTRGTHWNCSTPSDALEQPIMFKLVYSPETAAQAFNTVSGV